MDPSLEPLFACLQNVTDEFGEIREGIQKVVRVADVDPEMALARVRKVLESVVREVYQRRLKEPPGTRPLENLIQRLVKDGFLPARLDAYATTVRKLGNVGTHTFGEPITAADVRRSLSHLEPILQWYFASERPDAIAEGAGAARPARQGGPAGPDPAGVPPHDRENLLCKMWDHLAPSLQDAFLLAYNKKLREGSHRISTRDLFQALARVEDHSLRALLNALPPGALPDPIQADVPIARSVLDDAPPLSDCVEDSLNHFLHSGPLPRKLTPADMFVDIGKHGHGPSVARLREHGITAEELERRVKQRGLSLLRRK